MVPVKHINDILEISSIIQEITSYPGGASRVPVSGSIAIPQNVRPNMNRQISAARITAYILADKLALTNFKIIDDNKIRIYDLKAAVQEISKTLALNDIAINSISKKSETLEDYFLKMTGEAE